MVNRKCHYGDCVIDAKTSSENDVTFHRFPNPKKQPLKFEQWIFLSHGLECDDQLIAKYDYSKSPRFICSRHFIGGNGPTKLHPNPIQLKGQVVFMNNNRLLLREGFKVSKGTNTEIKDVRHVGTQTSSIRLRTQLTLNTKKTPSLLNSKTINNYCDCNSCKVYSATALPSVSLQACETLKRKSPFNVEDTNLVKIECKNVDIAETPKTTETRSLPPDSCLPSTFKINGNPFLNQSLDISSTATAAVNSTIHSNLVADSKCNIKQFAKSNIEVATSKISSSGVVNKLSFASLREEIGCLRMWTMYYGRDSARFSIVEKDRLLVTFIVHKDMTTSIRLLGTDLQDHPFFLDKVKPVINTKSDVLDSLKNLINVKVCHGNLKDEFESLGDEIGKGVYNHLTGGLHSAKCTLLPEEGSKALRCKQCQYYRTRLHVLTFNQNKLKFEREEMIARLKKEKRNSRYVSKKKAKIQKQNMDNLNSEEGPAV